jgi:imidazolonepropionase-like amidohydrolase
MARLVLQDANVLDGDNPGRRATVVVAGERIESVGAGPVELRPDDRVIDCTGSTVMPGMVLGHFHAAYWNTGGGGRPVGLEAHPSLQAVRAVANARTALECGFTGAISAGTPHAIDAALKIAIDEGTIPGPRLIAGSRDVGTTGFSADMSNPSYLQIGAPSGVTIADGPDEMARAVRQEVKDGAEIIKIFLTGGHATGGTGEDWLMSEAEFAAASAAARQRGAKTRAHLASKAAILLSIEHGIHIVDHGDGMDDECIDRLVESGTFLTPSLLFPREMMQAMAGHPFAEAMREPWQQMAAILPKASKAGVKLLVGDDYGAFTLNHGRYGEELALYVHECGVPALEVIRWATKHGAEAMGLGDQAGTVEAGKLADLLVVNGDPSADIALLQDRANLLAIMKGGVLVKDGLAQTPQR